MAVTLTTSYQQIGSTVKFSEENSYYYYFYAKYAKLTATTARIYVCFKTFGTGDESCSCSGATFHCTLNGSPKTAGSGSFSVYKRAFSGELGTITFDVSYDSSTGKWENKSISFWITGGSGTYSGGTRLSTCASASTIYDSLTLPAIDPITSVSISSVTALSGTYGSNNLWIGGKTRVRVAMTFNYMATATLQMTAGGVTTNLATFTDSKTTGCVKTYDLTLPNVESLDGTTFPVVFKITSTNNTGSASDSRTVNPYKYQKPVYDSSRTVKYRCDVNGTQMSQGEYGYLKLYWNVSAISGNALQSGNVKINGTTLTASNCVSFRQNISDGYFEYIFALPVNTQGNITTYLQDGIDENTQTSMAIPQGIMPLSLYQSGSSVGATVGRIATETGFRVYLPFYLLGDDGFTVYQIHVDANGELQVDAV